MINDSPSPPPTDSQPATPTVEPEDSAAGSPPSVPRRDFLRVAGASAGLLLVGGTPAAGKPVPGLRPWSTKRSTTASPDVVVIGAGGWGSFTALNLRKM